MLTPHPCRTRSHIHLRAAGRRSALLFSDNRSVVRPWSAMSCSNPPVQIIPRIPLIVWLERGAALGAHRNASWRTGGSNTGAVFMLGAPNGVGSSGGEALQLCHGRLVVSAWPQQLFATSSPMAPFSRDTIASRPPKLWLMERHH